MERKVDNMADAYERAKRDDEIWEREHNGTLYAKVADDGVYVTRENGETEKLGKVEVTMGDSREKIEAEVYNHIAISITPNEENDGVLAPYATVLGWLDRQAAITRRETRQNWQDAPNVLDRTNLRKIAELQSKVDELNAQNTRLNAEWAEANVRVEKLQAERDKLQRKVGYLQSALNKVAGKWAKADARVRKLEAELGSEPFCEQVRRWLNGDAPQECRVCGEGCYMELCEAFGVKPKRTIELHIGQEVCVHGYVDEVRDGTVIIRNDGGYFGTAPSEIREFGERSGEALPDSVTWPRFEDGELARFGDMFIHNNSKHTLSGVRFSEDYTTINGLHVTVPLKRPKRTVEDVLATFRFDAKNIYDDPTLNGNERVDELEALDADVAAELRGMGVCDE